MRYVNDADLQALVEACLEQNMTYGQTCREVREELQCGIPHAIYMTNKAIRRVAWTGNQKAATMLAQYKIELTAGYGTVGVPKKS